MNWRGMLVVMGKELVDVLRDSRTLAAMILLPVLMYPGLALIVMQAVSVEAGQKQREVYRIAVTDSETENWLQELLTPPSTTQPEKTSGDPVKDKFQILLTTADLSEHVRDRQADIAIETKPSIPNVHSTNAENSTLTVFRDATNPRADTAWALLRPLIVKQQQQALAHRLRQKNIPREFLTPIEIREQTVTTPEKMTGFVLGTTLPYFLVMMTVTSAMYPALDLTVGERERGTLESLMTAPLSPTDIMFGKFLASTIISIISSLLNLSSLLVTGYVSLSAASKLSSVLGINLSIPLSLAPLIVLLILPLAMLFSAMLLATCSFARSLKEAQIYITPVLLVALVPPMLVLSPSISLSGIILILPVANVLVLLRELFLGNFHLPSLIIVFGSSMLYAAATVVLAARLYGQEAVLFTDAGSYSTMFWRKYFRPQLAPALSTALLLLALLFPMNYALQTMLATHFDLPAVSLLSMVVVLLIPPLFLAWYLRCQWSTTFPFRWQTSFGQLIVFLLFPLGTLPLSWGLSQLTLSVFSLPDSVRELLTAQTLALRQENLLWILFTLAFVPAVAEEVLFRGFLLSALRRQVGVLTASTIVGLLFGLFHVDFFRVLPAGALGFVLSLIRIKTGSLTSTIFIHFLHNAIALSLLHFTPPNQQLTTISDVFGLLGGTEPLGMLNSGMMATCIGVVLCSIGLVWVNRYDQASKNHPFIDRETAT